MTSIAERKSALLDRLAELQERLSIIDTELESHNSKDWEELAVERETDEVLEGMGISGQEEIKGIKAALERIEDGEYGYCTACGAEISQDRLDTVAYTPFCQACAAKLASA